MVLDAPRDALLLSDFVRAYWSPVYAYIRRSGRSTEDAADLTQAFFASMLENPRLLEAADPNRGRFRTFLLTAIRNFLVDDHRREHGRDGKKTRPLPITRDMLKVLEPDTADDPTTTFDRQWATAVINEALQRVEDTCRSEGQYEHWKVFEERVLRPTARGNAPAPVAELLAELQVQSPQEVYSMVQTIKRRLHRELLAVVRDTLHDPAEAQQELAELLRVLGRTR